MLTDSRLASDVERFVAAQANGVYERALDELQAGSKRSHWMWFVFPQIAGLGRSDAAVFFAIADKYEAEEYLSHSTLGPRLNDCTDAMLRWVGSRSAEDILGAVDGIKFRSSMTLFDAVAGSASPFAAALEAFYGGARDQATLARL